MNLVPSSRYQRSVAKFDKKFRNRVTQKLNLFVQNKHHPSLRYKIV